MYTLFIGLDVADLAAVCALALRGFHDILASWGFAVRGHGGGAGGGGVGAFLIALALGAAFLLLFKGFEAAADAVRGGY